MRTGKSATPQATRQRGSSEIAQHTHAHLFSIYIPCSRELPPLGVSVSQIEVQKLNSLHYRRRQANRVVILQVFFSDDTVNSFCTSADMPKQHQGSGEGKASEAASSGLGSSASAAPKQALKETAYVSFSKVLVLWRIQLGVHLFITLLFIITELCMSRVLRRVGGRGDFSI